MLIRVTTQCQMGCSHCLANATTEGTHVALDTYHRALDVATELGDSFVMLSGGEPTEHPRIVHLVREAAARFRFVVVLSNGMWTHNPEATAELLTTEAFWQISNDPRFYPLRLPPMELETPKVTYTHRIPTLIRLGRWEGESNRLAPGCFNLRSAVRHFRSFTLGVEFLRSQRKHCTPSIDIDGTIRAGESPACYAIGTIFDTEAHLTEATLAHDCNRCGLHGRLPSNLLGAVTNGS